MVLKSPEDYFISRHGVTPEEAGPDVQYTEFVRLCDVAMMKGFKMPRVNDKGDGYSPGWPGMQFRALFGEFPDDDQYERVCRDVSNDKADLGAEDEKYSAMFSRFINDVGLEEFEVAALTNREITEVRLMMDAELKVPLHIRVMLERRYADVLPQPPF